MRIAAYNGIGLEDKHVLRWSQLLPKPGSREVYVHGITVRKVDIRDCPNIDALICDSALPDSRSVGPWREVLVKGFVGGVKHDRPVGAKNSMVVKNERNKTRSILGVSNDRDLILYLSICIAPRRMRCFKEMLRSLKDDESQ